VLTDKKNALWLPYQVGLEFHRNWLKVVAEQRHAFERTLEALDKLDAQTIDTLSKLNIKRHIALDGDRIRKRLSRRIAKVRTEVFNLQRTHRDSLKRGDDNDLLDRISQLYEGRVGPPYDPTALDRIYAEGKERYARDQPPGYKDKDKEEPDRYGDLVLWRELLDKATTEKRSAIFITDDLKDDWWRFIGGERKGARTELIQEYLDATGRRIQFYTPESFLKFAGTRGVEVSPAAHDEVKEVSRAYRFVMERAHVPLRDILLPPSAEASGREELHSERLAGRRRMRNRVRILEEQVIDLRRRRRLIDQRVTELHSANSLLDDGGMLEEYKEVILRERAETDAELAIVSEELARALDADHGQDRLAIYPHEGLDRWMGYDYISSEQELGQRRVGPWPYAEGQESPSATEPPHGPE
jgi:PIN like domain